MSARQPPASSPGAGPGMTVVIVTHNSGGQVEPALRALEPQLAGGDELVVVDNASSDDTASLVRRVAPRARVLEQGRNLGFAGAANAGAAAARTPLLFLLNPDAVPAPGCLDALRSAAADEPGWAAWQPLVTLPGGVAINTSGGVVHFLGLSWAGACGEPVAQAPPAPVEVGFASGAALVVRRESWERLGGFDERFFMYCEDLDLSLRLRLAGHGVGVVPGARVEHDYEFGKGARKWLLLERNRWWSLLSSYPAPLLALLAPALLASELALLAVALQGGWLPSKLRAQAAVARELPAILRRRRQVQATRAVSAAAFAAHLSARLDSPYLAGAARFPPIVAAQRGYWALVRLALGASSRS